MNPDALEKLLQGVYEKKIKPREAVEQLKTLPFQSLDFALVDHHRSLRSGLPEVIYCEGKSPHQVLKIIKTMHSAKHDVLATRLNPEVYKKLKKNLPQKAVYRERSRTLVIQTTKRRRQTGSIIILTAGTSDIPVAEEAEVTANILGSKAECIFDVGVAGIHRLLDKMTLLQKARVVIVVAGMDGALASVVGGLVARPVIAVPTSVGYGASFSGIAPLLTMLNSCAAGIATVNIDNGFGAGCLAHKINLLGEAEDSE